MCEGAAMSPKGSIRRRPFQHRDEFRRLSGLHCRTEGRRRSCRRPRDHSSTSSSAVQMRRRCRGMRRRRSSVKPRSHWVTTVRPDGRPHVTPLVAVWLDDALYFCTGDDERKARNLRENRSCVMTTRVQRVPERNRRRGRGRGDERYRTSPRCNAWRTRFDEVRLAVPRARTARSKRSGDRTKARTAVSRSVFRVAPSTIFAYGRGESFQRDPLSFLAGRNSVTSSGNKHSVEPEGPAIVTGRTRRWATAKEQIRHHDPARPMPIIQNCRTATDRTRTPLVSGRGVR